MPSGLAICKTVIYDKQPNVKRKFPERVVRTRRKPLEKARGSSQELLTQIPDFITWSFKLEDTSIPIEGHRFPTKRTDNARIHIIFKNRKD